ncbi:hypothetical protein PGF_00001250 [Porphyromonas gingivalis 381]|nr:hypothetical protein PGF_00001250 [Porphyromonas gingivalis 381]
MSKMRLCQNSILVQPPFLFLIERQSLYFPIVDSSKTTSTSFDVKKCQCIRSLISGLHTKILGVIGCSVPAIA